VSPSTVVVKEGFEVKKKKEKDIIYLGIKQTLIRTYTILFKSLVSVRF